MGSLYGDSAVPTRDDLGSEGRCHTAWLAFLREELTAPANALADAAERLRESDDDAFRKDVELLLRKSEQFRELVAQLPESRVANSNESAREALSDLSHKLRAPIAFVIDLCRDWQETEDTPTPTRHSALVRVRERAESLITRLQKLFNFRLGLLMEHQPTDESLQAVLDDLAMTPPPDLRQISPDARNGRILLVDDERDSRERLARELRSQGHEVTEAAGGREALARIAENPARFDAVLLDVVMPDLHGPQVLQRLKAEEAWRHLPVILVTAHDVNQADNLIVQCIARGAEDYLLRPVPPDLLRARVGACLEKKRLRDREMQHLQRIDDLLHAIIPNELVEDLKLYGRLPSVVYQNVGVMFLDIVGFTKFCQETPAEEVVRRLNGQVLECERIARKHGVQKIKTVGDAFMATAGLPRPCPDPVMKLLRCGLEMIEASRTGPLGLPVRIGLHVGDVVGGQLGETQFTFDLWGATVNVASRIEGHGRENTVTLSKTAWTQVADRCVGTERDAALRNVGEMELVDFVAFR